MTDEEGFEPGSTSARRHVLLSETRRLAGLDDHRACRQVALGIDGLESAINSFDLDTQARRDNLHGLRKADVAGHAPSPASLFKRLRGVTNPNPAENRLAESGKVHHALYEERVDFGDNAAGRQDQGVERKAGIDAGAKHRDAAAASERIELIRDLSIVRPRVCRFLSGRDHVRSRLDRLSNVVCYRGEERGRCDHDDVSASSEGLFALCTTKRSVRTVTPARR